MKQESHSSSSSLSSPSSPTVSDLSVQEREDVSMEALTPVILMKRLESRHSRDVRIWVSTVFILTSQKTEIARSVNGPKLQGLHAENAMAKPYLVLTNLVT